MTTIWDELCGTFRCADVACAFKKEGEEWVIVIFKFILLLFYRTS